MIDFYVFSVYYFNQNSYLCISKSVQDVLGEAMEKVMVEDEADLQQLVGAEIAMAKLSA